MRRGFSLIELMISLLIVSVAMWAVVNAYAGAISFERHVSDATARERDIRQIEDELRRLLSGATIGGTNGVFVSPIPLTSGRSNRSSGLVCTTWSIAPPSRYLQDQDQQFADLNQRFGPQGGQTEVAISMDPVGNVPQQTGLYVRTQRPADSDLTQGGTQEILSDKVRDLRFEFYDGSDWQTTWDSRDANKGKMPTAIRVGYLYGDEKGYRMIIVRLPISVSKESQSS